MHQCRCPSSGRLIAGLGYEGDITQLRQPARRLPVLAADGVDLVEGDQHVRAAQRGAAQVIASVGGQLPAGRQAALSATASALRAIIVRAAAIPSE